MITDAARARFELIGKEQLAVAIATGTYNRLGLSSDLKDQALEWINEQNRIENRRYWIMLGVGIIAAVASVVAAIAAVTSLLR